ncbi:DUF805 domain-containing protein [Clostridium beijerinckii]|uniref:DUF805 domain-containing protein n=1 Tax=Clostridium beijerinckii TaxID=1520 RepID=UPI0014940042|nr:DUF805 domain-containing protein [Clostridium beijerinckii]NOW04469.1 uncharacterized membrane protein YhaH (DUF805 family) [Clostridium beijerinckii]NRT35403.1 uncharacterized membrane protein YhaH (DUF805 family) [Clostridium beijerinckii]NRT45168.1 uncharacterized membrane protein YhaH (DUF805 family) [Clostridium beijerinckii]NRZ20835.1 uncharacterized membrane protein YhaH (DUF805 family) [Clostridium beijerinckii]NYC02389.1 uncharacterized membrane protein YhaH (DUF805 family) [Clostr
MNWYLDVLKKYAVFEGRACRKEYWMFILFNFLFTILAIIIEVALRGDYIVLATYILAMIIPNISSVVRRLHDIGKSGFWFFIRFIPVIGGIWMIMLLCTEGEPGGNQYGEDPKLMIM